MSKFKVGDRVYSSMYGVRGEVIEADVSYLGALYQKVRSDDGKEGLYLNNEIAEMVYANEDVVNHPAHYQSASGIEVIDVIEAFDLDRYRSNSVKYILRAGNKGDFDEDIKKAVWYLERLLKWREDHA